MNTKHLPAILNNLEAAAKRYRTSQQHEGNVRYKLVIHPPRLTGINIYAQCFISFSPLQGYPATDSVGLNSIDYLPDVICLISATVSCRKIVRSIKDRLWSGRGMVRRGKLLLTNEFAVTEYDNDCEKLFAVYRKNFLRDTLGKMSDLFYSYQIFRDAIASSLGIEYVKAAFALHDSEPLIAAEFVINSDNLPRCVESAIDDKVLSFTEPKDFLLFCGTCKGECVDTCEPNVYECSMGDYKNNGEEPSFGGVTLTEEKRGNIRTVDVCARQSRDLFFGRSQKLVGERTLSQAAEVPSFVAENVTRAFGMIDEPEISPTRSRAVFFGTPSVQIRSNNRH